MDIRNYYNIQLIEFVVIFKLFFNGIIMIRKLISSKYFIIFEKCIILYQNGSIVL